MKLLPLLNIANRVSGKIYSQLQSNHHCSRRLNATHQVGCSSELGGNLGVVWIVEEQVDLDHVLKTGPTPPYIAVLNRIHYTRKNLLQFKANPDRVAGVVLLYDDSKSRSDPFSPEDTCPNRYSGLYVNDTQYGDCKQNHWIRETPISGLLYDDIPYPIFLIDEKKSIDDLRSCFGSNNIKKGTERTQDTYPLCSMQLDSFMLAASDSETCLNSHSLIDELLQSNGMRCSPVGSQNLFAYYKPAIGPFDRVEGTDLVRPGLVEPQSIVLLMAKLSSLSMFTDISPGADSTVTSIVTLLAVAEALGRVKNSTEAIRSSRNIAFALIDSEPFDYTGSNAMVLGMINSTFPHRYLKYILNSTESLKSFNLTALDYVINLDQISNYPSSSDIFLHTDPSNRDTNKLNKIMSIFKNQASKEKVNFNLSAADAKLPLPPTPVQTFIKNSQSIAPENKLLGLVLSNYGKTYNDLFYNSIYDDSHNVFQTSREKLVEHISQVASFVAKSLFELTFKVDKSDDIMIDKGLVEDLLECYMVDANCNLFTRAWTAGQHLPTGPIQTYKDPTKPSDDMNGAVSLQLLAYFLGDRMTDYNFSRCYAENQLSMSYNFVYVNDKNEPVKEPTSGLCIRSQVIRLEALSSALAFREEGITIDGRYPAWTVSLNSIRNPVRLFLKPSPIQQWCIFLLGIIVTIMSFMIVHHIKSSILELRIASEVQTGTST